MKIGLKLPTSGPFARKDAILEFAQAAEALGYHSVWAHDHVTRSAEDAEHHFVAGAWEAWERPIVPNVFESISTLLWIAGQTERILLGTSVIVMPLRNPVWLAKTFATLDCLSSGRAILGVGVGGSAYIKKELAAIGHPEWSERVGARTEEAIELMRGVWSESSFSHSGAFFSIANAEVFPKPVNGSIPIWYGGRGPIAHRRVGRLCDGWMPMYLSPEEIAEGRVTIRSTAEACDRDPDAITIASEHWLAIDSDTKRALDRSERTRKGLVEHFKAQPDTLPQYAEFHREGRSDACNFVGDHDVVRRRLDQYRDAGVDHLIMRVIGHDRAEMMRSIVDFAELARERALI